MSNATKKPAKPKPDESSVKVLPPDAAENNYVAPSIKGFLESKEAVNNLKELIGMFMSSSGKNARGLLIFKAFCFMVIVAAIVALSMTDNFNAAVAFAFGTLAGYIFGTNND